MPIFVVFGVCRYKIKIFTDKFKLLFKIEEFSDYVYYFESFWGSLRESVE